MEWNKFDGMWHWWDRPDNVDTYFYAIFAPILGRLPVTFAVLSPLAIVGLVLALRRLPQHVSLYLLVLTAMVPLLLTLPLTRFRLPLAAAALPFASYALVQTVDWFTRRKWIRGLAVIVCMFGLALWTDRPLP